MRILSLVVFVFSVYAQAENLRVCQFASLPEDQQAEGFKHKRNRLASWFSANHSANDAVSVVGNDPVLSAKFSYGIALKDLGDEAVEIWLDDCSGSLVKVHRAITDGNGRILWSMPKSLVERPGEYGIMMRVAGDDTRVGLTLTVLPEGSKIVVMDVDGTLTASEDEIRFEVISDLYHGHYFPQKRDYASELSKFLHDRANYHVVYLTSRHYFMMDLTRAWLAQNGFARGTVLLAQGLSDILPRNNFAGEFKALELAKLKNAGLRIGRVYGNHRTDIYAYLSAGVSTDRIFIVGKHAGEQGTVGLDGFADHYAKLINDESVLSE